MPFHIETQDTYTTVKRVIPEGKTMCSLCSRLRRGILYRVADELGATRIALGHHRDDILETFFLNLFYGGQLKSMPPKLVSDDGRHVVIRPLAYVEERDLIEWAQLRALPDHSLQPVRLAGEPQAPGDQGADARLGEALPGPHRHHLRGARPRDAVAPARPLAFRFRRHRRHPGAVGPQPGASRAAPAPGGAELASAASITSRAFRLARILWVIRRFGLDELVATGAASTVGSRFAIRLTRLLRFGTRKEPRGERLRHGLREPRARSS